MKLLKCHIQNFGKLQDFNYDFQNGLNTIKQDNGFGKTTFATFIKSMFYGLDTQANARFEKSDRKKYIPWQGGIYGGSIESSTWRQEVPGSGMRIRWYVCSGSKIYA